MKIVFFGSDKFAVPSLEALLKANYKPLYVITQPDRESGRGLSLTSTPIKNTAVEFKLKIFQPANINTQEGINFLKQLNPDLFIVIAYGQILSQDILDIPKLFALNVHASLLPKYRGAAPINWSIIRGEKVTGVSVMKINEIMDAGPLMLQKKSAILATDTLVTLEEKLAYLGAQALLESLNAIKDSKYRFRAQDNKKKTFAPKLKKSDGLINWSYPAQEIHNLVRGCYSWPGAFTYYQGKLLKVFKTKVLPLKDNFPCGQIIDINRQGIIVATFKDALEIEQLQPEGKRIMSAYDFALGHKIYKGIIFLSKK